MAKTTTSDGGIDEVEIPHMVALEAKAGFTEVPSQHVAELLVMVLARVDRWMIELDFAPLESSLPTGVLTSYGVVITGTDVYFTKLVLTWNYLRWLGEGGEEESATFIITKGHNLANEDERLAAGDKALEMLASLHINWVEAASRIATEHKVTWDIDLQHLY